MAHTYTQESITQVGDSVTVKGTVDGSPVTVYFWASAVSGMTQEQQIAYVANLMLEAVTPTAVDLTDKFPSSATL